MRSANNNNAFGTQSTIQTSARQRASQKKQKIGQDSGERSKNQLTQGSRASDNAGTCLPLDSSVPVPALSFLTSAFLVALLSIGTYWNSRKGDFVFDDLEAIIKNQDVKPETLLWKLFKHDFWGRDIELKESHKSYRPLTVLTFRINYYLAGGLHPWGFHLVNIFLNAAVSVLVLPVSSTLLAVVTDAGKGVDGRFMECPGASFLCAILFAVHPIHTENVAGVVGRADLLCALFFFMSFLAYSNVCKNDSSCLNSSHLYSIFGLVPSMVLCALAMLCKEQGITVIGICSVYDIIINCGIDPILALSTTYATLKRHHVLPSIRLVFCSPELRWLRKLLLRHIILVTTAVVLLLTRFFIMGSGIPSFQQVDNPASFLDSIWIRMINYSYIYSLNAWLLFNPWWLCFDWSMGCIPVIQTPLDPRVVAPIVFWITMGAILLYCLFGPDHYERRVLTVSISAVIIPFLPASNIFFRVGFVIAERVLYLPSLGFCLLVVMGTRHLCVNATPIMKRAIQGLLLTLFVCHVTCCYHRNNEWLTERQLYQSGLRVCPGNAKVHYNIGKSAADAGHTQEAIDAYREAIRLHPDYDQALNNLGNILRDLNQTEEAYTLISKAVHIRPTFAAAWMNHGIVQATLKKYQEAEVSYLTALKHRKHYPDCYFNLGNLYLVLGRTDQAISAWLNATSLLNTHAEAWSNTLLLLDNLVFIPTWMCACSPYLASRVYSLIMIMLQPQYLETKQWMLAVKGWESAITHKLDHSRAWSNILTLYDDLGQYNTAVSVGQEALRHVKDDPQIYYAIGNVLGKMERYKEAEEMYLQAIHYKPDVARYHGNLGVLYHRWGKLEEAYHQYQRSLTLDPSSEVMEDNLRKLGRKLKKG
ncbi:protein O-mannosyl-transferase TMTC4-like [Lytechinus variegatus]|uniref:protein O-mannosyl-transferase TMTC4-like n=1 Tax=Lytechinus variegatus TaxID=7654 RepID=UPI001BB27E36|nr:protein O-mannosyl-transferase TMTC4-like [Lytechinus variegatus]